MGSTIEEAVERDDGAVLDHEALRRQVDQALTEDARTGEAKLPLAQAAPEVGIPYGTLSAWYGGSYKGNNDRVAGAVRAWLLTRQARKRAAVEMPTAPAFVRTPTASRIWDLLEHCQTLPDIGVIAGGAGIGKTTALLGYRNAASNVWIATMSPVYGTPAAALDRILTALGMTPAGNPGRAAAAIERKLNGTRGLLIIDEAQHLRAPALDAIRAFHDGCDIGIALCGNDTLYGRFSGDRRTPEFAQLFSRIGVRLRRERPVAKDIDAVLDAWGVEDDDVRTELRGIVLKPGAFRSLTKLLRLAGAMARAGGRTSVTLNDVRRVWSQIGETAA